MSYIKTIVRGSLGAVETWSTGISWGLFGLAPDEPNQVMTDAIANRLRTWTTTTTLPTQLRVLLSTGGTIDSWRVELRSEDERILNISEVLLASPVAGTNPPNKSPQDALVFSLRTNTPGARGRGRMYWPALNATLNASFQITGPTPSETVTAARTWLNAIGTEMNAALSAIGDIRTVVLSVRSVTDHVNRPVVSMQVGSILDTQRRRRDSLPESYSSVTYPA